MFFHDFGYVSRPLTDLSSFSLLSFFAVLIGTHRPYTRRQTKQTGTKNNTGLELETISKLWPQILGTSLSVVVRRRRPSLSFVIVVRCRRRSPFSSVVVRYRRRPSSSSLVVVGRRRRASSSVIVVHRRPSPLVVVVRRRCRRRICVDHPPVSICILWRKMFF